MRTMTDLESTFDKTVCYDGLFRIERYRLRHQLFPVAGVERLHASFGAGACRAVLPYDPLLTLWC